MPQNLEMIFAILGSVLLILALIGGNFKFLGAEFSSTITNIKIRILCFILSCVFILYAIFNDKFQSKKEGKVNTSSDSISTNNSKDTLPIFTNRGNWRPSANIIARNKYLKLVQFELMPESAYIQKIEPLFGAGPFYKTYSLNPNYNSKLQPDLIPNPIFEVILQNTSNKEILISKILYRVSKVGEVSGGDYGILLPTVKYSHMLEWKKGDQEFSLIPAFRIGPNSHGSFLLEVKTNENKIGLCWLTKIYFISSNENEGVATENLQLIMTGAK